MVHAYNALIALSLPAEQRRALLARLYVAAGQPPPPHALADALFKRGPIRAFQQLRALPRFGRRQHQRLRAVASHPTLPVLLVEALQAVTQTEMVIPERFDNLPHPLGEAATFAPAVARALGQDGGLVYGKPRTLPGFPFGEQIIHFRQAIRRPVPKAALIVGGGYVGCEMALAWAEAGAQVTLLERSATLLPMFLPAQRAHVSEMLRAAGVHTWLEIDIGGCRRRGAQIAVAGRCDDRPVLLVADVLLMAVGVRYTHKER